MQLSQPKYWVCMICTIKLEFLKAEPTFLPCCLRFIILVNTISVILRFCCATATLLDFLWNEVFSLDRLLALLAAPHLCSMSQVQIQRGHLISWAQIISSYFHENIGNFLRISIQIHVYTCMSLVPTGIFLIAKLLTSTHSISYFC